MVQVPTFLAADEWIKREWPKIIAEYSSEDTLQTKLNSVIVLCLSILICLKMKFLKGFKSSKERVTLLCCANMKVEKRDLLVIGKSKYPQCFKGVNSLLVDYYSNANAWMTNVIFNDWLVKWDLELNQKIVLLVDNCKAHTNNSLLIL
jgi:hypothetical protein